MRSVTRLGKILNAAAANGAGNAILVESFRIIILSLDTAASANMVIHIQGSIQETQPTWGSSQSATNQWDYVQIKDLEDGSAIDGDTGITFAGSDDHRQFEVNVNGLRWLNAIISSYTIGSAQIVAIGMDNE